MNKRSLQNNIDNIRETLNKLNAEADSLVYETMDAIKEDTDLAIRIEDPDANYPYLVATSICWDGGDVVVLTEEYGTGIGISELFLHDKLAILEELAAKRR
jgi:predicted unusual protein kinase regulating ubiquinone biosynthesis (AarF/ABC1/UbiB family)